MGVQGELTVPYVSQPRGTSNLTAGMDGAVTQADTWALVWSPKVPIYGPRDQDRQADTQPAEAL